MVGISYDSLDVLKKFQAQEQAPQRFVSDTKGVAVTAFGVSMTDQGQVYAKRATFIIRDGKVLHTVFDWSPLGNVSKTLDWLTAHPAVASTRPPLVESAAPAFTLPLIANGSGSFSLAKQRGHGVYINFFASWCAPCVQEAATIGAITPEFSSRGVRIVGIAVLDNPSGAMGFVHRYGLKYPIAYDKSGSVGAEYRLTQLPLHVFVDSNGVVRQYVAGGPIPAAELRAGLSSIAR